jgi:hypothetical protein
MAAPSASSIIRVPATLVWNGTTLGDTRGVEWTTEPKLREIWAEEFGCITDVIYGGERVVVKATLRYPDTDAISAICLNASGQGFAFKPGTSVKAGLSLYTRAGTLVITPKYSSHPTMTLNKAVPFISASAITRYEWSKDWGLDVVFFGSMDGSGFCYVGT